ncbi:Asp-tRNA(Asn)/Glu-tRNA(Gln) amidotransferase A subunit family amidase [Kibdelosporangium banguiense]|uniref:Asp-tRNA(Asn)/Glu-tRNA(Gln) amidotransferase A subunit family amidase n=1 Tax=Kibdelosporangium banguiense TaxID=1365924 RepID=A0ABS4TZ11_9PSEU|nr:amidase [Kibdelosporangium banguiense]MBP2329653.1 Asp-tRNA(Asn)/Glu-tRNA(Gln) amidotransferase A subunit family amidase [Kibdelosporangium banguiense]
MNFWQPWSLRELVSGNSALERSWARIAETEPELRAWVVDIPTPEVTAGPLGGVPLGVKDIIDVAGIPSKCGTRLRAGAAPAEADAAIVSAWRRAGAVPVGKTVTTEFAYFSPGPTRNPAAPGHTPGGSSSGSAAAVASGQVPLALGTQTAGSVTRPASFCGVASLVMTHGRFPMDGVVGLSPSLDSHGVYTATVDDLALAWSALTGEPDPALAQQRPPRLLALTATPAGPEMAGALEEARKRLAVAGAVVEDFPLEEVVADIAAAHRVVMAYEAARERAAELAVAPQLSPQLTELLRTGAETPEHDYVAAQETVAAAGTRVTELLATYDAVLSPAAPGPAPHGLDSTGDPILSRPWQALGLPAVTVPGLRDEAGLPLGIQLIGPAQAEAALLTVGCWVEAALRL